MKTFIYQGKDFQILVTEQSKPAAIAKIKGILNITQLNENAVYEGIFRATKL